MASKCEIRLFRSFLANRISVRDFDAYKKGLEDNNRDAHHFYGRIGAKSLIQGAFNWATTPYADRPWSVVHRLWIAQLNMYRDRETDSYDHKSKCNSIW